MTVAPEPPEDPRDPDRRPEGDDGTAVPASDGAVPDGGSGPAHHLSDTDVDAMFSGIVAGLGPTMRWGLRRDDNVQGADGETAPGRPGADDAPRPGGSIREGADGADPSPVPGPAQEATDRERAQRADREALEREITRRERERRAQERAQRREFRRVEREAELAAFEAHEAEVQAARDADQEHYDPPEPPPVPRPRGRTLGALACLVAGLLLLIRPGLVGIAPDAALVLSVLLLFAGAGLLVWGLRSRRDGGDDPDDGAIV